MAATDLCTLDAVKKFTGLDIDTTVDNIDDMLERLITSKTEAITKYIGFNQILAADYTEYQDGDGTNILFPYNTPINSITTIHDSIEWTYDADDLIDSDYYKLVDKRRIVMKNYVFNKGVHNIKVVYNAGFADIPVDLTQVCIEETVRAYNERLNIGISSRTDNKGGVTMVEKGWLKQSREIMNKYRKIGVY